MRRPVRFTVALAALLCMAQTAPPPSPQQIYGPLFEAVQGGRVFKDGKTFVDAVPKGDPTAIVEAYRQEQPKGAALRQFVLRHFSVPGEGGERQLSCLASDATEGGRMYVPSGHLLTREKTTRS